MQLTTERREVTTHGLNRVSKARVLASAKVFDMFENHYSDRFKAIVRELTSNAIDAHRQAGNTDPVKVFLPDDLDPYFRVQDRGIGMSYDFCMDQFMEYSNGSTKSGSNDAIGGFGIGSKSPFSYTDQFTLRSVHDGTCTVYSVFKDEDGHPCIADLQQTQTDEPNGVEFSVPVEPADFVKFRNAASKHLVYFGDEVQLFGAEITPLDYVQQGAGWGIRRRHEHNNTARVVMGGVAYPLVAHELNYSVYGNAAISPLTQMPVDLYLPIGACDIAPNREALLYNDKTSDAIEKFLREIVDEVTADMPTMFDHLPSLWQASYELSAYLNGDFFTSWAKLVMRHARYRGEELEGQYKICTKVSERWMIDPRKIGKRGRAALCPNPRWEWGTMHINPYQIARIIIDDLQSKDSPVKRIKTFVDDVCEETDRVLVIRAVEGTDISKVLEEFGNPPEGIITKTSELPAPPKAIRSRGTKTERPRVRMFELNYRATSETGLRPLEVQSPVDEIPYSQQPDGGVLLVCDNFNLPDIQFWQKMYTNLLPKEQFYLVNKGDAARLDMSKWTLWDDEFNQRLARRLAATPTAPQYKALMLSALGPLLAFIKLNPALFQHVTKSKPLAKLVNLMATYDCAPLGAIERYVEAQLPPRLDPEDLLKRIERDNWQFMTLYNCAVSQRQIEPDSALFRLLKENI